MNTINNRFNSIGMDMNTQKQAVAAPFHLSALARAMSFAFLMTLTAAAAIPSTAFAGEGHDQVAETAEIPAKSDGHGAEESEEEHALKLTAVQQALANSVLLQIDLTDTASSGSIELMEHFEVFGLPSILFFD